MYHVPSHISVAKAWVFYPEYMVAQNCHNGNWATFHNKGDGTWSISCINCPAQWMLEELGNWFCKWINGNVPSD